MSVLNATHDPQLRSWVESANAPDCDFPIQNLPFGRFRRAGTTEEWRLGVAIGDQILDLKAAGLVDSADMNAVMGAGPTAWRSLRAALSEGLSLGSRQKTHWLGALLPQTLAEHTVPCRIADYTDFYTGIHHATAVGRLFRPDQPLMPNYKWVPIGYHGRASSIVVSGERIKRPSGQTKKPDAAVPEFGPSRRLDYELELGYFVGSANALGTAVPIGEAEDHLFGICLLNDWSARDLQAWEYQPLGPFLAKNFATTVSPWIITMEALAPFRTHVDRPVDDPQPLPYLDSKTDRERGGIDVALEVWLQTSRMAATQEGAVRLSTSRAAQAAYWSAAQLVAHHTSNGCNLQPGDLLGSGTLSGPEPEQAGSLLELSAGGTRPVTLPNGETRTFLEDGDRLVLRGWCERPGAVRIGLGEAAGIIFAR